MIEFLITVIGYIWNAWLAVKEVWAAFWSVVCFVPFLIYWAIVQAMINRKEKR
mgnify:CR=1 FL=1